MVLVTTQLVALDVNVMLDLVWDLTEDPAWILEGIFVIKSTEMVYALTHQQPQLPNQVVVVVQLFLVSSGLSFL